VVNVSGAVTGKGLASLFLYPAVIP
jgi:hypothetical protein